MLVFLLIMDTYHPMTARFGGSAMVALLLYLYTHIDPSPTVSGLLLNQSSYYTSAAALCTFYFLSNLLKLPLHTCMHDFSIPIAW